MTKIRVLYLLTYIFFNHCDSEAKSLVAGMEKEREIQQDEIASQELLHENSRNYNGYDESNGYSNVGLTYNMPVYRTNLMKRSPKEHSPGRRQTGIIYGGGKPIGILQPYQESFKFMPIKEEHVYSLDGGRANIDQQEPYLNLMYPLARFTRSEDAVRMAELEAAKAEFLDKHYPSMLVDFKIHNKLHTTGFNAKSEPTLNLKREETNPTNKIDMRKKKRESQYSNVSNQKLHKRDNQQAQKRVGSIKKKQVEQTAELQKMEDEKRITKREEEKSIQKKESKSEYIKQGNLKMERPGKLTDSEFENLKECVSKRNSNENIQTIEEDLKGLLSDMGLIEDDLEDNAEEMEGSKSAVVQDENIDKELETSIQKDKEQQPVNEKRENKLTPERKKRAGGIKENTPSRIQSLDKRNTDAEKAAITELSNKQLASDTQNTGKRYIEVSFSSKEDKESTGENSKRRESCPKPSVIPNKREITKDKLLDHKRASSTHNEKIAVNERSEKSTVATTETYEQYEQRVAREIKNKIKQLKEEVKRELGALETDEDEEEEEGSLGEPQRKKRFIVNTLMDEETHNIDPNENLDGGELEPHVRRRRTLSTDIAPLSSFHENIKKLQAINSKDSPIDIYNEHDFEVSGYNGQKDPSGRFRNQERFRKDDIFKKDVLHSDARSRKSISKYGDYFRDHPESRSYRSPMYSSSVRSYFPKSQKEDLASYASVKRNSKNDLNSESGSYNDYEDDVSNSNSEEEADGSLSSVLDMTSKSAENNQAERKQLNHNIEHSPKKLHSFNQKYVYYYSGSNEKEKNQNMRPHLKNVQWMNRMYSYHPFAGQYPSQFYNTINRFQHKQFIRNNEKVPVNRKSFQRRFEYPFARRRKRFTNLMIPPYQEDAVVTNSFFNNYSRHPTSNWNNNNQFRRIRFPLWSRRVRITKQDDMHDYQRNITGQPNTEKGKHIYEISRAVSPESTPMIPKAETQANSSHSFQNSLHLENQKTYETRNNESNERYNKWYQTNFLHSLNTSEFSNVTNQLENHTEEVKKSKSFDEEDILGGRKMLFWLEKNKNPKVNDIEKQTSNYEEPPISSNRDNIELSMSSNSNSENLETDYYTNSEKGGYDENHYPDNITMPLSRSTVLSEESETTSQIKLAENSTIIPLKENESYGDSYDSTDYIHSNDKNNLIVQNTTFLPTERKRRKRNIQPEYHQDVRTKRYWLWPSLAFSRDNVPYENEVENYDPFVRGKEESERLVSSEIEDEADLDGSSDDLKNYGNNNRNIDSKLALPENRLPYVHTDDGVSDSFMTPPRNRRYVQRNFREPQQRLLSEMSETELFGALPQSYAGELVRYKRVKRSDRRSDQS